MTGEPLGPWHRGRRDHDDGLAGTIDRDELEVVAPVRQVAGQFDRVAAGAMSNGEIDRVARHGQARLVHP